MTADVLVAHGALETAVMVLTEFARNNPVPVRQGFISWYIGIHSAQLTT